MFTSATRAAPHHSTATGASSSSLPLLALAAASFAIGTTEYVVMGLLPDVATDLGVSVPKAGLLVSGYALSVAFGSPFLAVATALDEDGVSIIACPVDYSENMKLTDKLGALTMPL